MSRSARDYRQLSEVSILRQQAVRVWSLTAGLVFLWAFVPVSSPLLLSAGNGALGLPIFEFLGYICHQIPERSLHIMGHQLGVCSRCFGVYAGLFVGVLVYPLWRRIDDVEPLPRFWLFASLVPLAVDWSLGMFGVWENTHLSRLLTGMVLGAGCATYIVPALVEITRNIRPPGRSFSG